jgi:hypothetical protein
VAALVVSLLARSLLRHHMFDLNCHRQEGHAMTLPGPQEGLNPAHLQAGESDDDVLAPATPGAEALGDGGADADDPGV